MCKRFEDGLDEDIKLLVRILEIKEFMVLVKRACKAEELEKEKRNADFEARDSRKRSSTLDISSRNYLSWVLNAEIHLDAKGLGNIILVDEEASNQDKAQAMIFIRHHLHEGLKVEYLTLKDPLELWKNLKERFDHYKTVILPKAHYDRMHLWLQDFKTVSEYNLELFKISSQLKLCGENITDEDLLAKIFSTFHATNVLLQQ
ncbi:uncharacterized protein [Gossypium hirsutum]|uniref:Uncharacterized protein n=1 Tax=Gossypium hirsutum TaxID=3635 RepID=A0A1U8J1E4_GOSHI|nr:uncharacterized protein LOC107902509 [Gossypium hirsutum]